MTQEFVKTTVRGKFSSPNHHSAPEGATLIASNVDRTHDGLLEVRKGFSRKDGPPTGEVVLGMTSVADVILGESDANFYSWNGTTWTSDQSLAGYGQTGSAIWGAKVGDFYYYISQKEDLTPTPVYRWGGSSTGALLSGLVPAGDIQIGTPTGSGTAQASSKRVAYRIIFGYDVSNSLTIWGAPSGQAIAETGGSGPYDIPITATIIGTTVSRYKVFKSGEVSTSADPNDNLQLCYEGTVSGTDLTNGYISFTDITPTELRGETLYTSPAIEGIEGANYPPPYCAALASFKNSVVYGNLRENYRFYLTILGTGASGNVVQVNDTITLSRSGVTEVYTAKAAENIGSKQFAVDTTSATTAIKIRNTAQSLVKIINRGSSTYRAQYISGPNDLPGKIVIEYRDLASATVVFKVYASRPASLSPSNIAVSGTTAEASGGGDSPNAILISKPGQPDAVPLYTYQSVGPKHAAINAMVALEDALIIFKEDGIYRLTGSWPSFEVSKIDTSARLIAPRSAQVLNNEVYCLTTQGVVAINNEVRVISRAIEEEILTPYRNWGATTLCFAAASNLDRRYYLFMPTGESDTYAKICHVYHLFTDDWTSYDIQAISAAILVQDETETLVIAHPTADEVWQQFTSDDSESYVDPGPDLTISSISGTTVVLASLIDQVEVGDILVQGSVYSRITDVDYPAYSLTILSDPGFTTGAASLEKGIETQVQFVPNHCSTPGKMKQINQVELFYQEAPSTTITLSVATDISQEESEFTIEAPEESPWGAFPWGGAPWGGGQVRAPLRQWLPIAAQRGSFHRLQITHRLGRSSWKLQGYGLYGKIGSEKNRR